MCILRIKEDYEKLFDSITDEYWAWQSQQFHMNGDALKQLFQSNDCEEEIMKQKWDEFLNQHPTFKKLINYSSFYQEDENTLYSEDVIIFFNKYYKPEIRMDFILRMVDITNLEFSPLVSLFNIFLEHLEIMCTICSPYSSFINMII